MHKGLNADLLKSIVSTIEGEGAGGGTGGAEGEKPAAEKGEPKPEEKPEADPPGAEHLGDPGKKALETMKGERNQYKAEAADWKSKFDALTAQVQGKEAEHAAKLERERVQAEALGKANERILKAEIRAAAAGKLADPTDALLYVDLASFEVGDNGDVDQAAITAAIDGLVTNKPYLAAQGGARFQGSADGGARNESPGKSMKDQIAEAEKAGDFTRAIRLRQQLAAEIAAAAKK